MNMIWWWGFLKWNPKRHLNFQGFVFGLLFCKSRCHAASWQEPAKLTNLGATSRGNILQLYQPCSHLNFKLKILAQPLSHATPDLSLRETGSIWVRPCWPLKSQQNGQAYLIAPGTRTSLHDLVCSQQGRLSKGRAQWLNRIFLRMAF